MPKIPLFVTPKAMFTPEERKEIMPILVEAFDAAIRLGYHTVKDAPAAALPVIPMSCAAGCRCKDHPTQGRQILDFVCWQGCLSQASAHNHACA